MADLSKVLEQLYGTAEQASSAPQETSSESSRSRQPSDREPPERFSADRTPEWASDERLDAAFSHWADGSTGDVDRSRDSREPGGHSSPGTAVGSPGTTAGFGHLGVVEDANGSADMVTAPITVVRMGEAPWQRGDDDILPDPKSGRRKKASERSAGRRFRR